MNRNQNGILLIAVLVSGVLSFLVYSNNLSLKGVIKNVVQSSATNDGYTSPFGPKPAKGWERGWEAERAR